MTNKEYKEGVSVVIVTYNGSERLEETLIHLSKQKEIDFDIEVLLIDNNSTDNTPQKVITLWDKLSNPFEIRVVSESQSGTMFARKRGVKEAKYRYMLYCDDDNWLNPNYVSIAYRSITQNEDIAAVGGRGIMEYENNFIEPLWIKDYKRSYGVGNQGKTTGDITHKKGCLYTAGTILDLKWLDKLYQLGFVSSLKGRDGKTLVAGEDTELTYALKLIGGILYYNSEMHFKHYMPSARINWEYLKRLWWAFGYAEHIISPYNYFFSNKSNPKRIFLTVTTLKKILILLVKGWIKGNREGDMRILSVMKLRGQLKAILKEHNSFKNNKEMIKMLNLKKVN